MQPLCITVSFFFRDANRLNACPLHWIKYNWTQHVFENYGVFNYHHIQLRLRVSPCHFAVYRHFNWGQRKVSVEYESAVPEYSSVRFSVPGCTCCLYGFLTPFWSSHLTRFPYMTSFCPTPPAGLLSELSTAAYITEGWLSGSDISTGKGFRQYISIITAWKGLTCVWISVPFLCIFMCHIESMIRTRQIWR